MRRIEHFEVVTVERAGVPGHRGRSPITGIVMGVPPHHMGEHDSPIPDDPGDEIYAVTIQGESEGWCVRRRYLEPTGERVPRERLYDGSSIRVDRRRVPRRRRRAAR
jgi:hypothetical protein